MDVVVFGYITTGTKPWSLQEPSFKCSVCLLKIILLTVLSGTHVELAWVDWQFNALLFLSTKFGILLVFLHLVSVNDSLNYGMRGDNEPRPMKKMVALRIPTNPYRPHPMPRRVIYQLPTTRIWR